ncbi:hypothetical protein [Pontibacillus salipaludis]|uniref:Uncharacterized protein n=1 Tax=Pontibacillus salipaludis TaxID=1697394 RepID=A0ABQ1PZ59_9BACI|nr:hypothetical protein [Pontibacillus salipaludis]GGD07655.1 hypothetical protein GCM10011389_14030 [Pontibacillus salipaludis]
MSTVMERNKWMLKDELSEALVRFSEGKLSNEYAREIANITLQNVDFNNSALAHKGVNWFAKDLLRKIVI